MDWKRERRLIGRVQKQGCRRSLQKLIEELNLYQQVYNFVRRYLKDAMDVEEVTQETLARAFFNIERFDAQRSRFRSWVFGIAMHQVYDCLRKKKHTALPYKECTQTSYHSPEEILGTVESSELFLEAIDYLKERYRQVFILYYVEGLSLKEIAKLKGISSNNVGTILNRARLAISEVYQRRIKRRPIEALRKKSLSEDAQSFANIIPALSQRLVFSS